MICKSYLGNFGDVNPFEHGGLFIFELDNEDADYREWAVVEVINKQDVDYQCFNQYATMVAHHSVSSYQIKDNLQELASSCGWSESDLYIDNEINWGMCAAQMVQFGLVEPYENEEYEKFTELTQFLVSHFIKKAENRYGTYYEEFESFQDDLRFYLQMDDEYQELIEWHYDDFVDSALDMIVEIAGFPEIDRESLLDQIIDENFIIFDEILQMVEFDDLLFIANVLRGGFRRFASDFMAAIFKHETRLVYFNPADYGKAGERLQELANQFSPREIKAVEVDYDYQITLTIKY
jgi:hypothetical protein